MYRKIRMQNYKPFRDLSSGDLQPVTLISGRNNSGKTALLEALFLHACGPLAAQHALTTLQPLRGAGLMQFGSAAGARTSPWSHFFRNYDMKSRIGLTANVDGADIEVSLRGGQASIDLDAPAFSQSPATGLPPGSQHRLSIDIAGSLDLDSSYTQVVSLPNSAVGGPGQQFVQFPSFDIQPQPNRPLREAQFVNGHAQPNPALLANRFSSIRISGRDELLLHAMHEIEPRLASLEVLMDAGQPTIFATFGSGRRHPLSALGEGMSRILELLCTIIDQPNSLLLVDEIAEGIHWSALPALWAYVYEAARVSSVQIVATTHSRECLISAWRAGTQRNEEFSLLRLQIDSNPPYETDIAHYDAEALAGAIEMDVDIR